MTLHWRQALTSALVGTLAALAVGLVAYGTLDEQRLGFIAVAGLTVGAGRLIELPRR